MTRKKACHKTRLSQCTDYLSSVRDVLPLSLRDIVKDCSPKDLSRIYDSFRYHTSISPKQISKGSFSIVVSSCYNIVKTISSFAKLYNFELRTFEFASSFTRLLHEVVFEDSQYSIKKRIDHYANFLFPDSELRLTGVRIMKGPLGHFYRDWARRLHKYGSKNERASISMSFLKINNSICRGDYRSLALHDLKYKSSSEPKRSRLAQVALKQQIKKVVSAIYKPVPFRELSHIDAPFHNGSFETSKSQGGSHSTLINEREEYLYMGYNPRLGVSETKGHPWWDDQSEWFEQYDAKVCHIADKGKIRSITAISAHANNIIKKYQRYFYQPIWDNKIFSYTQCDPQRESSHFEDMLKCPTLTDFYYWISGDYEKCTDMFSIEWSKYVVKCVCKTVFGNEWWRYYEIADTFNLNLPFFYGQPQGHGLSFAILCIINLAIISFCFDTCDQHEYYYRKKGDTKVPLYNLPVKINGDDIVFASTDEIYQNWCDFCVALGLKVNQVKSYRSTTHFTLNSRAFTFVDDDKCINCVSSLPAQICTPPCGSINLETNQYFFKKTAETVADYSSRMENFIRSSNSEDYIRRMKLFFKLNPIRPGQKYFKRFSKKPPLPIFVSQDQGGLGIKIPPYIELNSKPIYKDFPKEVFTFYGSKTVYEKRVCGIRTRPKDSFLQINGEQRAHMQAFSLLMRACHSDLADIDVPEHIKPIMDYKNNHTRVAPPDTYKTKQSCDRDIVPHNVEYFEVNNTQHFGLGYNDVNIINLDHDMLFCATEVKEQPEEKEKSLKRWLDLTYMFRGQHHFVEEKLISTPSCIAQRKKQRKTHNLKLKRERTIYSPLEWLSPLEGTITASTIL